MELGVFYVREKVFAKSLSHAPAHEQVAGAAYVSDCCKNFN